MSYANVAAKNAPPESEQPHPDPALLETGGSSTTPVTSEPQAGNTKINVVPASFEADHSYSDATRPAPVAGGKTGVTAKSPTDTERKVQQAEKKTKEVAHDAKNKAKELEKDAKRGLDKAEREVRSNPDLYGGLSLLGLVNLVALGGTLIIAYRHRDAPRWDRRIVAATVIGLGTLFTSSGWAGFEWFQRKRK